jgi:hypothetical protein
LTQVERFGEKATQEQEAKVVKMQGGSTLLRSPAPKPSTIGTPQTPLAKKGTYTTSTSTQLPADQPTDNKKKGADDKEILADPSNPNKKLWIST